MKIRRIRAFGVKLTPPVKTEPRVLPDPGDGHFTLLGVPLEEMALLPGTPVIKDGYLKPSDAPGFGIEVDLDWLEERAV